MGQFLMMIRNIIRNSFIALFYGTVAFLITGWVWTKIFKTSNIEVSQQDKTCAENTLIVALEPIEEGLCFQRVVEKKNNEVFIFHNYSFFGMSCGRHEVVCDSYTSKLK